MWAIRCLLAVWARLADRGRARKAPFAGRPTGPSISIVVAARNEARRLPARITNLLDQDYPGRREIIVVSDGSTDDTAARRWRRSSAATSASSKCRPAASRWR